MSSGEEDEYGDSFESDSGQAESSRSSSALAQMGAGATAAADANDSPSYEEYGSSGARRRGGKTKKSSTRSPKRKGHRSPYGDDEAATSASNPGNAETIREQRELIDKLQMANAALRQQLKEFGRALEASLQTAGARKSVVDHQIDSPRGGRDDDLRLKLERKQRHVASLKKKLSVLSSANKHLKDQLRKAFNTSKISELSNELKVREQQIRELKKEQKMLKNMHRKHTRELEKEEDERAMWPKQIANLNEELRVANERLRRLRDKVRKEESSQKKSRAEKMELLDKNRELKERIAEHQRSSAHKKEAEKREKITKAFEEERSKLGKTVETLQKRVESERAKTQSIRRKCKEKIDKAKKKMDEMERLVKEKEKEIRMQVIVVKKLKLHLKGLVMEKDDDVILGDAPWAANIAEYNALQGVESGADDGGAPGEEGREEEEEEEKASRPALENELRPTPAKVTSIKPSAATVRSPQAASPPTKQRASDPANDTSPPAPRADDDEYAASDSSSLDSNSDQDEPDASSHAAPSKPTAFAKPAGMRKKKKTYVF